MTPDPIRDAMPYLAQVDEWLAEDWPAPAQEERPLVRPRVRFCRR